MLGDGKIQGEWLFENNGYSLYSIIFNSEKAGWYLQKPDGTVLYWDSKAEVEYDFIFKPVDKIDETVCKTIGENGKAIVYFRLDDVNHDEVMSLFEKRYPTIFSYMKLMEDGEDVGIEKVNEYVLAKRVVYSEAYNKHNEEIVKTYINEDRSNAIFISQFSPLAILEINDEILKKVEGDDKVLYVEQFEELEVEDQLVTATSTIQADYVRDTLGHKGIGVKIGQVESGQPNKTYSELNNSRINPRYSGNTSDHASRVAVIMAGTTNGIAKGATLYSTFVNGIFANYYSEVEYLLGKGVSIINASFGFKSGGGTYDITSQWTDHLATVHDVHFVAAAGNDNHAGGVGNPGMAYNAVTVGAFDTKGTTTYTDDTICSFSSAYTAYGYAIKPEITAPGYDFKTTIAPSAPVGERSGTSFAAPMAAATIAQMINVSSSMATKQVAMRAVLTASAFRKLNASHYGIAGSSFIDSIEGAGKLDSKNARYIINGSRYVSTSLAAGTTTYTKTFSVNSSSNQIRVSLAWLKRNSITGSHTTAGNLVISPLGDLDLAVYDPSGKKIISSTTTYSNFEVVEFNPSVSGTYKIEVKKYGNVNQKETFALAWW